MMNSKFSVRDNGSAVASDAMMVQFSVAKYKLSRTVEKHEDNPTPPEEAVQSNNFIDPRRATPMSKAAHGTSNTGAASAAAT